MRSEAVGVVTQEPVLLPGTVRENIAYGRPNASMAEVRAAARGERVSVRREDATVRAGLFAPCSRAEEGRYCMVCTRVPRRRIPLKK